MAGSRILMRETIIVTRPTTTRPVHDYSNYTSPKTPFVCDVCNLPGEGTRNQKRHGGACEREKQRQIKHGATAGIYARRMRRLA